MPTRAGRSKIAILKLDMKRKRGGMGTRAAPERAPRNRTRVIVGDENRQLRGAMMLPVSSHFGAVRLRHAQRRDRQAVPSVAREFHAALVLRVFHGRLNSYEGRQTYPSSRHWNPSLNSQL